MGLRHLARQLHSKVRAVVNRVTRSPKWRSVEKAHLRTQPALRIAHGDNFKAFNPNVLVDLAGYAISGPIDRPAIWARAKAARQLQL